MITQASIRNKDFVSCCKKVYHRLVDNGEEPTLRQVVEIVLNGPAPAYYVDYYRANSILLPAFREGRQTISGKYRCTRVWNDMLADLRHRHERYPAKPLRELILELCIGRGGNPRFYMTRRRAMAVAMPFFTRKLLCPVRPSRA